MAYLNKRSRKKGFPVVFRVKRVRGEAKLKKLRNVRRDFVSSHELLSGGAKRPRKHNCYTFIRWSDKDAQSVFFLI